MRPYSLSLLLVVCAALRLFAEPPALSYLFPGGGSRGSTAEVNCPGTLDWWVQGDAPGVQVEIGEESGKLRLEIPAIWWPTAFGCGSTMRRGFGGPFFNWRSARNLRDRTQRRARSEQVERLPLVINGVIKSADVDTFRVHVEAGQTLVAAVDAHTRLGSPIDAILQIALPSGIVLAENHDSLGLDPRVSYRVQTSGDYLVRLFGFSSDPNQSIALQGGNNCIYRLTLTIGGLITHAVPLAIAAEGAGQVELHGWNLPEGTRASVLPLALAELELQLEWEPLSDLRIPAAARLGLAGHPEMAGQARVRLLPFAAGLRAETSTGEPPAQIELPWAVTGCLREPGQRDHYRVALAAGQTLLVTVEARTLGLAPDPLVRMLDSSGKRLVEVEDSAGGRDAVLTYAAKADGLYTIEVLDRFSHGGDQAWYLLTAQLDPPDFELRAVADQITLGTDKAAEFTINIVRRGNVGPITITALGLPEYITMDPVVSATEGDSAKALTLKFAGDGSRFSGPIAIMGQADEPISASRYARTPNRLGASLARFWLTALPESK